MDSTPENRKRVGSPITNGAEKASSNNERRRGPDENARRRRYDDRDEQSDVVYFLYADMKENDRDKDAYVETLKNELTKLDPTCVQSRRLVEAEITRIRDGKAYPQDQINLHRDRLIKLCAKIAVPVHEYPQVSFLGRIFGPGGENLKNLCRQTRAKIGLFGAGCTKSPEKEKDMLRRNDPQYDHLNEGLHLYVETIGFPAEAYARLAHVMNEARKFMDPYYPGIPNMKPEEIKRLILEQRRVSGLYKPTNKLNEANDAAVTESFQHATEAGTDNNNNTGSVVDSSRAIEHRQSSPVPPYTPAYDTQNARNFSLTDAGDSNFASEGMRNMSSSNPARSNFINTAPLAGSHRNIVKNNLDEHSGFADASVSAGYPADGVTQPRRMLSPPAQQQQHLPPPHGFHPQHATNSAAGSSMQNYGMQPPNVNAPYQQQQFTPMLNSNPMNPGYGSNAGPPSMPRNPAPVMSNPYGTMQRPPLPPSQRFVSPHPGVPQSGGMPANQHRSNERLPFMSRM